MSLSVFLNVPACSKAVFLSKPVKNNVTSYFPVCFYALLGVQKKQASTVSLSLSFLEQAESNGIGLS
jgi:hypothetical protein